VQDFRELIVWQRAHQVVLFVYRVTSGFPRDERFEITRQMRRAAVSIPANIAEGCGRTSARDMARFLQIAMGSACELEYFSILATDLGLASAAELTELAEGTREIKKMLTSLGQKLITES